MIACTLFLPIFTAAKDEKYFSLISETFHFGSNLKKRVAKSTIFLTVFGQLLILIFFYDNISLDSGQNSIRNADIANCLKLDLWINLFFFLFWGFPQLHVALIKDYGEITDFTIEGKAVQGLGNI